MTIRGSATIIKRRVRKRRLLSGLGKSILAAGQLESSLREYLRRDGVEVSERQGTLGVLTKKLADHSSLTTNGQAALELLNGQRNYFAHKLFDLFSDRINETNLPREGLVDGDGGMFTDYAWQLAENLRGFSSTVQDRLSGSMVIGDPRQLF